MARGRTLRLGIPEQDLLALWGAKTAYALLAATGDGFIESVPFEHRQLLREQGIVPADTWIGYGSWDGYINRAVFVDLLRDHGDEREPRSWLTIFAFGKLALMAFGVDALAPGKTLALSTQNPPQIFPRVRDQIPWPTRPALCDQDLRDLVTALENAPP